MGNQESGANLNQANSKTNVFENSYMLHMHQVQNATLIKCITGAQDPHIMENQLVQNSNQNPLFYLQKIFVSDSKQEYDFLTKYLEKQSIFGFQNHSAEIIKIAKIYQESQKGFCSNRYLIRALFEYSDITLRHELKARSSKLSNNPIQKTYEKHYFRYEDLCNIMFACISSLLAVQKMKQNLKRFIQSNQQLIQHNFHQLDFLKSQFKYNIPVNLDRIIIMSDGTIKIMHPLLLDHEDRIHHSHKFFYSPQKMKDFLYEDGIKGRIFQVALVILQCSLLQNRQKMEKVYKGYCVNNQVLQTKINMAIQNYKKMQNLTQSDMKLFDMLRKMTINLPQKRMNLEECIYEAQNLFQFNKKMKQSTQLFNDIQIYKAKNQRMSVEQLDLPYRRISQKIQPLQNPSCIERTAIAKKDFCDQKTTARVNATNLNNLNRNRQQVSVSHFNIQMDNGKLIEQTRQNTYRNPLQSLMINNNRSEFKQNANQECLESLIGKSSNLYQTQKFNFPESKHQYGRFYSNPLANSKIQEAFEENKTSESPSPIKTFLYKRLINKSLNPSNKPDQKGQKSLVKSKFLRQKIKQKQKGQASLISKSKFLDIENVYKKYDFIQKSEESHFDSPIDYKKSYFGAINQNQRGYGSKSSNKQIGSIGFTYSIQNSQSSSFQKTGKISQVLQKFTPSSILNCKQKENSPHIQNF